MNLSAHIAVGSAVGVITQNPALGFAAGILSHHIIDMVPHTDPGSIGVQVGNILNHPKVLVFVFADGLLGLFILYLFALKFDPIIVLFSGLGGVLPDLIDNVPFWTLKLRKTKFGRAYHKFHETFHSTIKDKRFIWAGIATQVLLIFVALFVVGII